ncbi:unnamed protein product [Nesidiocoris tenuis]|uniref:Uncharacterized protein n=1 Tax=Nesidiocoris tenuis TaxID=355587 RepID=A0A6H5G3U0_9HEMI|nr:unnamed protein product [Nesidiocoris tenuis]
MFVPFYRVMSSLPGRRVGLTCDTGLTRIHAHRIDAGVVACNLVSAHSFDKEKKGGQRLHPGRILGIICHFIFRHAAGVLPLRTLCTSHSDHFGLARKMQQTRHELNLIVH